MDSFLRRLSSSKKKAESEREKKVAFFFILFLPFSTAFKQIQFVFFSCFKLLRTKSNRKMPWFVCGDCGDTIKKVRQIL